MNTLKTHILFLLLICSQLLTTAQQQVIITSTEQKDKKIYITYDLSGKAGKHNVQLYVSADNGKKWEGPLNAVSGDVGNGQTIGNNKQIVWDVLQERDKFVGDWVFGIEAVNKTLEKKEKRKYDQSFFSDNLAYIELGGHSMISSINYERFLIKQKQFKLSLKLGVGIIYDYWYYGSGYVYNSFLGYSVYQSGLWECYPLTLNILFRRNNLWNYEFSLGSLIYPVYNYPFHTILNLGMRKQIKSGFCFRWGVVFDYNPGYIFVFPQLSFGRTF